MATAHVTDTIEDVIRILREEPEVCEAVRRQILTDELLEMPRRLAEMAVVQEGILATLREHSQILHEHTQLLHEHGQTLREHGRILGEHGRILGEHGRILGEHAKTLREHTGSIGELKGSAAFGAAERRYRLIALQMDLSALRLLDPADVAMMTRAEAASEFTASELNSFIECDLVIEAESPSEGECYVMVQVSYTVDHGDIDRAIRHAQMATRLTGRPAYPAVAGIERAGVTEERLASGAVHWHRMPRRAAQPR